MKSTGGNEVRVTTNGAFQCWMYENYYPNAGDAGDYAAPWKAANWV